MTNRRQLLLSASAVALAAALPAPALAAVQPTPENRFAAMCHAGRYLKRIGFDHEAMIRLIGIYQEPGKRKVLERVDYIHGIEKALIIQTGGEDPKAHRRALWELVIQRGRFNALDYLETGSFEDLRAVAWRFGVA